MQRMVIDIETLGFAFESFDPAQQDYLMKFANSDTERTEAIQRLSLYPATARIIVIGMMDPDTGHGRVHYHAPASEGHQDGDPNVQYVPGDESEMLTRFWRDVEGVDQIITFNGRGFDCPFLLLRSAMLGIKASRDLMPYRYDPSRHCDLLDQLTFYGATRRFSLDFYCKAFGIESPKSHGITGLDLRRLYDEGRYREIAEYNCGDLRATADLFSIWSMFLAAP